MGDQRRDAAQSCVDQTSNQPQHKWTKASLLGAIFIFIGVSFISACLWYVGIYQLAHQPVQPYQSATWVTLVIFFWLIGDLALYKAAICAAKDMPGAGWWLCLSALIHTQILMWILILAYPH